MPAVSRPLFGFALALACLGTWSKDTDTVEVEVDSFALLAHSLHGPGPEKLEKTAKLQNEKAARLMKAAKLEKARAAKLLRAAKRGKATAKPKPFAPKTVAKTIEKPKKLVPAMAPHTGPMAPMAPMAPVARTGRPKIPANVLFNYKFNLLEATEAQLKEDKLLAILKKNVEHTLGLFEGDVKQVIFWDDEKCVKELKKLKSFNGHDLARGFQSLRHGKYKSDLCRLAQLYKHGGYYFDLDILPVKNMRTYLDPDTTFATCRSMMHKEIFQAFLATTAKNEVIGYNLHLFDKWLKERRHGSEPDNIGTVLMWKSLQKVDPKFRKRAMLEAKGQKIQLFQENKIKIWKRLKEPIAGLLTGHSKWGECNIAVVNEDTDEVVFYPRVISKGNDDACAEEKRLIVQHFLEESTAVLGH